MPYLQVDLPVRVAADVKRRTAFRLGCLYAEVMQTRRTQVNVGFRELGPDNLFRCQDDGVESAVVVQCDIRRGRPAEQRLRLAEAIRDLCTETFGVHPEQVVVEFTQHPGDEMFRDNAWGREWSQAEAGR
ncbi:MAG: tautomerase family protein [Chloroflexi bacterium]|nr:tautomerase family protein [Chloroflexota bacterium]